MGDSDSPDDLLRLLREYAIEADRLRQVFAEINHMHVTDLDALFAVMHAEQGGSPMTPGRLGQQLGLSSGATTAVIDRLERAGHVHRMRDERDRRRVTLRHGSGAAAVGTAYFGPLSARLDRLLAGYSSQDQELVCRFLADASEMLRLRRRDLQLSSG